MSSRATGFVVAFCLALGTAASGQVRGTAVWVGPVPPAKVVGPAVGGAPPVPMTASLSARTTA